MQAVAHGQQRQEVERVWLAWVRIKALEQALVLAEPEGYVRIDIDEGAPMAALLRQAATCGIGPGYVTTLSPRSATSVHKSSLFAWPV